MRSETVSVLHPERGPGGRMDARKYDEMRAAILGAVPANRRGIALDRLPDAVRPFLSEQFGGANASVPWYCVTVELDLEARGLLERVPERRPRRVRRPNA